MRRILDRHENLVVALATADFLTPDDRVVGLTVGVSDFLDLLANWGPSL